MKKMSLFHLLQEYHILYKLFQGIKRLDKYNCSRFLQQVLSESRQSLNIHCSRQKLGICFSTPCAYYQLNFLLNILMNYSTFFVLLLPVCVLTACSSNCATCVNPFSSSDRYRCTSCYSNFALASQTCYSCNYCSYYDVCDACGISTTSSSSSSSSTYSIIFGLLGGIILISLVIIFIYYKCRVQTLNYQVQAVNQGSNNILINLPSIKWTKTDRHINLSQNCAICLQNNANVLTRCNHLYHPRCIWEWCNRKEISCPLCKGNDLQYMRYYCSRCTMNYLEVPIAALPAVAADVKYACCGQCGE